MRRVPHLFGEFIGKVDQEAAIAFPLVRRESQNTGQVVPIYKEKRREGDAEVSSSK